PRTAAVPIASMYRDVFMGVVLSFFTLNCERSPFGWPLVPRFRGIQHTRAYRFRLISPAPYRIYGVKCHSHAVIALQHETRARPIAWLALARSVRLPRVPCTRVLVSFHIAALKRYGVSAAQPLKRSSQSGYHAFPPACPIRGNPCPASSSA